MVSIVPLQRRTEASPAAAAGRGFFSLERRRREEEEGRRMDLSGLQGELPIPMHAASPYGGGHVLQMHGHEHGSSNNGQSPHQSPALLPSPPAAAEDGSSGKKRAAAAAGAAGIGGGGGGGGREAVKYRECLKNHAAAIGGNATDGCGEFMPSGEEGSLEALKCSACGCHRNFHRKEADGDVLDADVCGHRRLLGPVMMPPHAHHKNGGGLLVTGGADPYGAYAAARAPPPPPHHHHHQYIIPLSAIHTSESDEMDGVHGGGGGGGGSSSSSKKRFRTKFTPEQKASMLDFAERVGWRLQRLDDGMVQAFCQQIGVKRRVLKVWMHNNKHSLATPKLLEAPPQAMPSSPPPPPQQQQMPMEMMPPAQPGPSHCHLGPASSPPPLKLE